MRPRALRLVLLALYFCAGARALIPLPDTRHHRFLTYGLFGEEQTALLLRDSGDAWTSVGASIAFVEADWRFRPQLVFTGNIAASLRRAGSFDYAIETFDGRFQLSVELDLGDGVRLLVGALHASGHVADGTLDPALMPPNLSNDGAVIRVVWDVAAFRLGATLTPAFSTEPAAQGFAADQFAEWYPLGADEAAGVPYLAAGLAEGGPKSIALSWHVQAGVNWGAHRDEPHRTSFRVLAGYYDGIDPRLKYAQIRGTRSRFFYAGLALNF